MPNIRSLNECPTRVWIEHTQRIADAGATALEPNTGFVLTESGMSGQQVETDYLYLLPAARKRGQNPKAVKIGPYFALRDKLSKHGIGYLQTLFSELLECMREDEYWSSNRIQGTLSRDNCHTPVVFELAHFTSTHTFYMDLGHVGS